MTYLKNAFHVVAVAGLPGRSLKNRRHGPWPARLLMAILPALGLVPGLTQADTATEPPATAAAVQVQLVNINTADAAALAAGLRGVGLSRAEDIIRYRETYGPFGTVEELVDVKGIGQATLDKNRAVITLE